MVAESPSRTGLADYSWTARVVDTVAMLGFFSAAAVPRAEGAASAGG